MTIEDNIFKQAEINKNALAQYGFQRLKEFWVLERPLMNGDFKAVITIDSQGHVLGNVYEIATEDEYLPLRVESMDGFANDVRNAYIEILKDIKDKCCHENVFISSQANRLADEIYKKYRDKPVFPWDDFSGGVFKNPANGKWYAIIMCINVQKIDKKQTGQVEVVNIKLDPQKIEELLSLKGFYPAYHMNKKYWVSILLNDTVSDDLLFELLDESHTFTLSKRQVRTVIKTKRLKLYPATREQMEEFITVQSDENLKAAYSEMLSGSLAHPRQWNWYAIWMIELKDSTHIGELCFKGLDENGVAEIGYGILENYQNQGFASEAVQAVVTWALKEPHVTAIEAETEANNIASKRVLEKCGFEPNGQMGQEGPRYVLRKNR